ncbi:MAG: hypothetical protein AAF564_10390 [Bacteroidota bacterium]
MVTPDHKYYISFASQEVAIQSEDPDVIAPFLLAFRELLVDVPADLLGTLSIVHDGDGYRVDGAKMFEGEQESPRGVLQCLKFEVIHRFVEVHPELLWLHAGAASLDDKAIMLCGAWGSGKSTMVGNLCKKGWTYLSDDIVPIHMESGQLVSFPLTPMMRAHDAQDHATKLSADAVANLNKQVVELADGAYATREQSLAAIVFPQYDPKVSKVALTAISPAAATLELLRNCLNLKYHKEDAVQFLGTLVEKLPVYMLRYNDGVKAAELLIGEHRQLG